jgi:hypothetical protein
MAVRTAKNGILQDYLFGFWDYTFVGVVKKPLWHATAFFYNRPIAYAAIPYFGTLLWKAV